MKHNKQYNFLFIYLLFCSFNITCKKSFLEVPDKRILLRQEYVKDLKTTQEYLNGIYAGLAQSIYHGYNLIYPELIADNIKPVIGTQPLAAHYLWSQQIDDDQSTVLGNKTKNMNPIWLYGYKYIRACSFIIETVDKYRTTDATKADNIKGQAYSLRALIHFTLANIFSQSYNFTTNASHLGIPYITTSNWTNPISRQSVENVYNNLIQDLKKAIELLPVSQITPNGYEKSLFTKYAAKALLARVYLFKEDYVAAKNLAREVGSIVPIMTGSSYPSKLFTPQETEALFQLPPAWDGAGAGNYYYYTAGLYFSSPLQRYVATNDIASIINEDTNDVRNTWVSLNSGSWRIAKYPTNIVPGFSVGTLSYYQTLLRSSEMYLTAAEAYAKTGNEDSARYYLDAIRMRANPMLLSSSATGSALLDSIYEERRIELAFEGLRMFDLLRWKKGVNRIDANNSSAHDLPYPNYKAIAPLPLSDVTISGLQQNLGY